MTAIEIVLVNPSRYTLCSAKRVLLPVGDDPKTQTYSKMLLLGAFYNACPGNDSRKKEWSTRLSKNQFGAARYVDNQVDQWMRGSVAMANGNSADSEKANEFTPALERPTIRWLCLIPFRPLNTR